MELVKHPMWEVFPEAETFENFQKKILLPVYFKTEVPNDIKELGSISEKLLLYSYYEYEFIEVALTQAVFTFEKALKIRWKEIQREPAKKNLAGLIDWFYQNNYFETRNDGLPHQLRIIRNGKVHEETKLIGGVAFISKVYETFDLINDIYESRNLRVLRNKEALKLTDQLIKFTQDGTIVSYGEIHKILFATYPIFINNKTQPNTLNLLLCPIFDLSKYERGEHYSPPSLMVTVTDWQFNGDIFRATDVRTGEKLTINRIGDEINRGKFLNWYVKYYRLNNWMLAQFETTAPLNDLFIEELRNLHRLQ